MKNLPEKYQNRALVSAVIVPFLLFLLIFLFLGKNIATTPLTLLTYLVVTQALFFFLLWQIIPHIIKKKESLRKENLQPVFHHPEVILEHISGFEYSVNENTFTFTNDAQGIPYNIFSAKHLTLDDFLQKITQEEQAAVKNHLFKVIEEKIPFTLEFQVIHNHSIRDISMKGRVYLDETGEPEYLNGVIQDITDFRKKEASIKIYERQLSEARRIANLGTWSYDFATDRLNMSPEALHIIGITDPGNAPTRFKDLKKILPIKQLQQAKEAFGNITTNSRSLDIEYPFHHPDGILRIHRMVSGFSFSENGKPHQAIGITQDITNFRETEKILRQHKERLERTQQLAQIAFFDYDWENGQFDVSAEFYRILDIRPYPNNILNEILNRVYAEDIVRLRGHVFQEADSITVKRGEVEFRAIAQNGRIKYLFAQYQHTYAASGKRLTSSGWLQDMTSHRINEMALAESEEKYRNMFAMESDALFLCNHETEEILETNTAATRLFGYSATEFKRIKITQLSLHPEIFQTQLQQHNAILNNLQCKTKEGQTFTGMVTLAYFVWRSKNVHLAAFRDITKLITAEHELELTKFALDHSALMVYVIKKDGSFHYINDALCQTLGYNREELFTRSIYDIHYELNPSEFILRWNELKWLKKTQFLATHLTKDGEKIPCEVTTNYLVVSGEAYKVAFVQDIRLRIELEEQVRHSEKMNAVGQLAGGIAHDFNNQLMGISGYAHILYDKLRNTQMAGYVEQIIKASEHSADLTGKLLAFSRKGKYISLFINAHDIINECVMLLKPGLGKNIDIKLHLNAGFPHFKGDTSSIQNALLNIAINARDAMKNGGEITISTYNLQYPNSNTEGLAEELAEGEYLAIEIKDNGSGISPNHLEKIFEPFFSTKPKGRGTGLGLSATFGTIQSHNGTLQVKSEINKGSTFTILLPTCHDETIPKMITEQDTVYGEGKIILVDDEEIVRTVTAMLIKNLGYEVIEFSNGADCIAWFKNYGKQAAAVILDLIMPGMSGYEVFRALKTINPNVKVLLFSGFSVNDEAQKAIEQGAVGYLQKPTKKEILSQQLARIVGKSGFHQEKEQRSEAPADLPVIPGTDLKKALLLVEGNKKVLEFIFLNFHKKYHGALDTMEKQLKTKDFAGLYLLVHSIKSLAGNMGATKLNTQAQELENMLDTLHPQILPESPQYNEFKKELQTFLNQLEKWDKIKQQPETLTLNKGNTDTQKTLENALEKIDNLIKQYSPLHIDSIKNEIKTHCWPENFIPVFKRIISLINDYDFEEAGKQCEQLKEKITTP